MFCLVPKAAVRWRQLGELFLKRHSGAKYLKSYCYLLTFIPEFLEKYISKFNILIVFRKTCQSCKCPREAHAIYQQQTTNVHERLGFKLVSPADSGVEARDLGFTWVPPGVRASSRINRYFEQLPEEVVPRLGSDGACIRERQISYQLPKQDLSLEHCKHLEVQHEASFEDFVTARNEIALDIGGL